MKKDQGRGAKNPILLVKAEPFDLKTRARGIKVQAAMLWIFQVLAQGAAVTPPPCPESLDAEHYGGGTPNMKLLYCFLRYAYSLLSPTPAGERAIHCKRMVNILSRERLCHGQSEPTTATHGQLWLGAIGACIFLFYAARLLADITEGDREVLLLSVEWLQIEHAIHTVAEVNGDMWCAGGRGLNAKGEPLGTNSTRAKMFEAITTGKVKGRPNQYDVGAHLVARTPALVRDRIAAWPKKFPPMAGEFHARRFEGGDCYTYFESLPGVLEPVLSAGCYKGKLWISTEVDRQQLALYEKREPILSIDTKAAAPAGRE